MSGPIITGNMYGVQYPFSLVDVDFCDEDGPYTVKSWRPGVRYEGCDPDGDKSPVADGHGEMLLAVVDVHKPGKYPERVYFTRKWKDPNGKVFGKPGLRITTTGAFRALLRGYRYDYGLPDNDSHSGVSPPPLKSRLLPPGRFPPSAKRRF